MKITIKEHITREIEVSDNFPIYRGGPCHAFKISSLEDFGTIQITHYSSVGYAIKEVGYEQAFYVNISLKDISEKEFNTLYDKVLARFNLKK